MVGQNLIAVGAILFAYLFVLSLILYSLTKILRVYRKNRAEFVEYFKTVIGGIISGLIVVFAVELKDVDIISIGGGLKYMASFFLIFFVIWFGAEFYVELKEYTGNRKRQHPK